MNKNRYLTEEERYNIDLEFRKMILPYKLYLRVPREFLTYQNILLTTTDIGVLTLFVKEKNNKCITECITEFNYNFLR